MHAQSWFEQTFGFPESIEQVQRHSAIQNEYRDDCRLVVMVAGDSTRTFHVGPFEIRTIKSLRQQLVELRAVDTGTRTATKQPLSFDHMAGYAGDLHRSATSHPNSIASRWPIQKSVQRMVL